MGYRDSLEDLDGFTADCFMMISAEIDKLADEEMKKASKGKK